MDNDRYLPIGRRIRQARRRRGLSQDVLGGLIGRSSDWVSKAERGDLPVDRISVLIRVADVLRVPLAWLIQDIGHDIEAGNRVEQEGIRALRSLLTELPYRTSPDQAPRSLASLEADLWAVEDLRGQVRHAASLAALLPMLTGLHDAAVGLENEKQQRAYSLLVRAYEVTARILGRYGERHLSHLAGERAAQAAERSGLPDDLVFGTNSVALGLQGLGYLEESIRVAEGGLSRAQPDPVSPRVRAMCGHVYATTLAITYARAGDDVRAREAVTEAEALLRGPDGQVDTPADIREWTQFRPANLLIQRVSMSVDAGNPREALRLADLYGPQIHAEMASKSRRSRHLLDVAQASGQRRDTDRMVVALLEIEQLAPEQLHGYALVPEMVYGALRRERGPRNARLHALAARLKVA